MSFRTKSISEASTLTIDSNTDLTIKKKPMRKATGFHRGPKSGGLIDNKPYSWQAVRSKSRTQRKLDRFDDTQKWLDSKNLLSDRDKAWLSKLSDNDKAALSGMLEVNKWFCGGVRKAEDRNKIRAQVMLMAARYQNLDMAKTHKARLLEHSYRDQPRLYKSLNAQSFFNPTEVAAESNLRHAKDFLARRNDRMRTENNDPCYMGDKITKSERTHQAITALLDKNLLDHDASHRLRRLLRDDAYHVNILMNIDENQVPQEGRPAEDPTGGAAARGPFWRRRSPRLQSQADERRTVILQDRYAQSSWCRSGCRYTRNRQDQEQDP